MTASSIDIGALPVRMLCRKSDGQPLDDVELLKRSITMAEEHQKKTGKPININPKFMDWAKEAVAYCEKGGKIADFKEQTIIQTIPDYDLVCKRTEEHNKKAARSGEFDVQTEKKIIRG